MTNAIFISSPELWQYRRGGKHPAQPDRLRRTVELLTAYNAFDESNGRVIAPRQANEDELARFHTREYIRAVRHFSDNAHDVRQAHYSFDEFGFGKGDNPIFAGMYQGAALRAGGALMGAELLIHADANIVFHFAGGQHHAQPARTTGFCIFNDVALAIDKLLAQGYRVAYVDIDAHHGDGVQDAFYDDDRVLTISLHEFGIYPQTGRANEIGLGRGEGFSINIPLLAGTDDDIYLRAFNEIVPRAVENFHADVLVTEFGTDAHFRDPLAHLNLTTRAFTVIAQAFRALSRGKWLCVGGGGYRVSVVPRVWTLVWGEMIGCELDDALPDAYRANYIEGETLRDADSPPMDDSTRTRAREYADEQIRYLRAHIPLLRA